MEKEQIGTIVSIEGQIAEVEFFGAQPALGDILILADDPSVNPALDRGAFKGGVNMADKTNHMEHQKRLFTRWLPIAFMIVAFSLPLAIAARKSLKQFFSYGIVPLFVYVSPLLNIVDG